MDKIKELSSRTSLLVSVAALVVIIAGIYLAQSVVVLFLVAMFLAILGAPPLLWLKAKRIPSGLAVTIVMAVMILLLLLVGAQTAASVSNFLNELPLLQSRIREQALQFSLSLAAKGIIINESVFQQFVNPGSVMRLTAGLLAGVSSALSDLLLILLTVTFILLEVSSFPVKLRSILGDPLQAFPQFTMFVINMKRYMVLKTIINLIAGVIITVWMQILGVQFPVLWGFLAFLLHYIPNIGAVIAAIPAALMALVQLGPGSALMVIGGNIFVGFVIGNVVEPRLMGRRLGLSTLVVFLSLLLWGSLLGIMGAILCIPLTMTLKFAFECNEDTRWISMLLGPENAEAFSVPIPNKKKP